MKFNHSWICILVFSLITLPGATAQGNLISWPTVFIAWIFSVISYLIIFAFCFCIKKILKHNKKGKRSSINREESGRVSGRSGASNHTGVTLVSSTHPRQGYGRPRNLASDSSNNTARYSGEDVALITGPIQRSVSQEVENRNRRKAPDFTSKWCTRHGLSEHTANVLRDNGFRSEASLGALKPEDVHELCLPSKAEEVLLREVLMGLQRRKYSHQESGKLPYQKGVPANRRAISSGDLNPNSESSVDPESSLGLLDKAYSENEMEECGMAQFKEGLPRSKSSAKSFDVIEEGKSMLFGANSAIELQGANGSSGKTSHPHLSKTYSAKDFNGILSDKGLHSLAKKIGSEWQHLATLLSIPNSIIEQIRLDYQGRTRHQIYEMLKLFRDSASGSKEQIKGTLQVALENIGRRDLSNELLEEQVHGSVEKIPYHSIV